MLVCLPGCHNQSYYCGKNITYNCVSHWILCCVLYNPNMSPCGQIMGLYEWERFRSVLSVRPATSTFQSWMMCLVLYVWQECTDMYLQQQLIDTNQVTPVYRGWLYVFVPVRTPPAPPPAADSCPHDNFWTAFGISFIFGTIVGPDL